MSDIGCFEVACELGGGGGVGAGSETLSLLFCRVAVHLPCCDAHAVALGSADTVCRRTALAVSAGGGALTSWCLTLTVKDVHGVNHYV